MRTKAHLRAAGWLFAVGLAFFSAAVEGQSGVTITQSLETSVTVGMTTTEVDRVLGRPARVITYRDAPGPTWTYRVAGAPFGITDFDISFGADGKVVYASERILGGSGR
jgi:hypothetical protein